MRIGESIPIPNHFLFEPLGDPSARVFEVFLIVSHSREVAIDGFLLSGGHRSCCFFHCRAHRRHLSARKTAESDGVIVNSMERSACAVFPPQILLISFCVEERRDAAEKTNIIILDPETGKKLFS